MGLLGPLETLNFRFLTALPSGSSLGPSPKACTGRGEEHYGGVFTRRRFLGLLPALGAAKSLAAASGHVPTRAFGRHAEQVSVIGLGGLDLGRAKDQAEATRIARDAMDRGINFFDNAWCYLNGRAEEIMGRALDGVRDKAFLMTKCCSHQKPLPEGGKEGAMKMLEESLQRLRTDRLDLWMLHAIENPKEIDKFYGPGGTAEAFELAKQQGKVRYFGFTGHSDVEVHRKILEGGFSFDASLQPVSALGTLQSRKFEAEIIPELRKKEIAVLGMKGFGGAKRAAQKGLMNAEKVVRYALSYPEVCTQVIGIDELKYVEEAALAAGKTPMNEKERQDFAQWCDRMGGAAYAMHCQPGHRDGGGCGSVA